MKIAIDISPVGTGSTSAHKVRGVGSYIKMLVDNLQKFDKNNTYVFVENDKFPDDVELIHYPYFDPFFITLPIKSPKKFAVTVHDLTPLVFKPHFPAGLKGKLKWQIQKRSLSKARAIISDSDCSKRDVVRLAGIDEKKVHTVYLAADEKFKKLKISSSKRKELQNKYSLPEDFVLYVGDATWNKNLPNLVEAIKKTKNTLVLIGKIWGQEISEISSHPWTEDLKYVISNIKDDKQFVRLGFVSDEELAVIYNMAAILVMPSLYEGFGLPVLEAMSCGCPVVTTKEGSLPEVGGEAVYYVDAKSPQSIADGISALVSDEKLRKEFSERGIIQSKKFTVKRSIEELVKIYENVT